MTLDEVLNKATWLKNTLSGKHIDARVQVLEDTQQKTQAQLDAIKADSEALKTVNSVGHLLNQINTKLATTDLRLVPDYDIDPRTKEIVIKYSPLGQPNYFKNGEHGSQPTLKISADENGLIIHNGLDVSNSWMPTINSRGDLQLVTALEKGLIGVLNSLEKSGNKKELRGTSDSVIDRINTIFSIAQDEAYNAAASTNSYAVASEIKKSKAVNKRNRMNTGVSTAGRMAIDSYVNEVLEKYKWIVKGDTRQDKERNKSFAADLVRRTLALYLHSMDEDEFYQSASVDKEVKAFIKTSTFKKEIKAQFDRLKAYGVQQGVVSDSTALNVYSLLTPERPLSSFSPDSRARKIRATNATLTKRANKKVANGETGQYNRTHAIHQGAMMSSATEKAMGEDLSSSTHDLYRVLEVTQEDINKTYKRLWEENEKKSKDDKSKLTRKQFAKKYGNNFEGIIEDALIYSLETERDFDSENEFTKKLTAETVEKEFEAKKDTIKKKILKDTQGFLNRQLKKKKISKEEYNQKWKETEDNIEKLAEKKILHSVLDLNKNEEITNYEKYTDAGSGKDLYAVNVLQNFKMNSGMKSGFGTGSTRAVPRSMKTDLFKEILADMGYSDKDRIYWLTEAKEEIGENDIYNTITGMINDIGSVYFANDKKNYVDQLNQKFAEATGATNATPFKIEKDGTFSFNKKYTNVVLENMVKFFYGLGSFYDLGDQKNPFAIEGEGENAVLKKLRPLTFAHEINQLDVAHYGGSDYKGGKVSLGYKEMSAFKRVSASARMKGAKTDKLDASIDRLYKNNLEMSEEEYKPYQEDYKKAHAAVYNMRMSTEEEIAKNFGKKIKAADFKASELKKLEYDQVTGNIKAESYEGSYLQKLDEIKQLHHIELLKQYGPEALEAAGIKSWQDVPIYLETALYSTTRTNALTGEKEEVAGNTIRLGNYHSVYNKKENTWNFDDYVKDLRSVINKSNRTNSNNEYERWGLADSVNKLITNWDITVNRKEGSIWGKAHKAKVPGSMQPTAIAQNPDVANQKELNGAVFISRSALKDMHNQKKGESNEDFYKRISLLYNDVFAENDETKALGNKHRKKIDEQLNKGKIDPKAAAKKLLDKVIEASTYNKDKNSLYQKTKGRGMVGLIHRWPSIDGKDMHYCRILVDPDLHSKAVISGDPILVEAFNGDYDGDHYVLTAYLSDGSIIETWTEEGAGQEELSQARDVLAHDTVRVNRFRKIKNKEKEAPKEKGAYLNQADLKSDQIDAHRKTTFLTKYNKKFTGNLDNIRQAIQELLEMAGLDETGVSAGDVESQKDALASGIIRATYQAISQNAISAKKSAIDKATTIDPKTGKVKLNNNWWHGLDELYEEMTNSISYASSENQLKIVQKMKKMGILEDDDDVFKDRIATAFLDDYDEEAYKAIFGEEAIKDWKAGKTDKLHVTDQIVVNAFSRIFGNREEEGSLRRSPIRVMNPFSGDYGKVIDNIGDILNPATRKYLLPGVMRNDWISSSIGEYTKLGEIVNDVASAVNQEATAEKNKTVIAANEGQQIDKLANSYKKLGANVEEVNKLMKNDFAVEHSKAITTAIQSIFPTSYGDSNSFEKELRAYLSNPENKGKDFTKVRPEDIGYDDERVFNNFRKGYEPLIGGKISDSLEQSLIFANKNGWNVSNYQELLNKLGVSTFEELQNKTGISYEDLMDTSEKGAKNLTDKINSAYEGETERKILKELFANDIENHEEGLFTLIGKDNPLLQLMFGQDASKYLEDYTKVGAAFFRNTMALAGNDIANVGPSEQHLITSPDGKHLEHGRSDTITYGTQENYLGEKTNVIQVTDKKFANKVSPSYIAQVLRYIMALQQAQADIINNKYTYNDFLENSDLGKWYKEKGLDEELFNHLAAGDAIAGGINLVSKKTGRNQYWNLGTARVNDTTGLSDFVLTSNTASNQLLAQYLNSGMLYEEWPKPIQELFYNTVRQNQSAAHNFNIGLENNYQTNDSYKGYNKALDNEIKKYRQIEEIKIKIDGLNDKPEEHEKEIKALEKKLALYKKQLKALENIRKEQAQGYYEGVESGEAEDQGELTTTGERRKIVDKELAEKAGRLSDRQRRANYRQLESLYRRRSGILAQLHSNELSLKTTIDPLEKTALRDQREYQEYDLAQINEQIEDFKNTVSPDDLKRIEDTANILTGRKFADVDVRHRGKNNFWGQLGMQMTSMFERFLKWGAASRVIQTIRRDIQKLIQSATQLDKAITNLRIVTGKNDEDASKLVTSYSNLANQLGATTTEVANSANEWLRQGYAMNEVTELVTASMYLSKLGMISSEEATKDLTSSLKAFKIEAMDAMSVVDKLTSLDINAATTAGEIANALQAFGVTASMNGLSIDQASAMAATIMDVSQAGAGSVGNALKWMGPYSIIHKL